MDFVAIFKGLFITYVTVGLFIGAWKTPTTPYPGRCIHFWKMMISWGFWK